jgi:hypothetical protein
MLADRHFSMAISRHFSVAIDTERGQPPEIIAVPDTRGAGQPPPRSPAA